MKKITFMLLMFICLVGCGGRNTSVLESAITGHWLSVKDGVESHMYVGHSKIIYVYNGVKETFDYVVNKTAEKDNFIVINQNRVGNSGSDEITIKFTNDKRNEFNDSSMLLNQTMSLLGNKNETTSNYSYVDAKAKP